MKSTQPSTVRPNINIPTVLAIACIAYLLTTALHEHGGHALTCLALGGRVRELNAFYVDCDYLRMSDMSIRLVALAGPIMSLLTGMIAFLALARLRAAAPYLRVWLWLVGSIGLMTATGYLLFSGVTGLGDFGVSRDGILYALTPEWLWRVVIIGLGVAGYALSMRASIRAMEIMIGGSGPSRVAHAQRLSLTSYIAGGLVSVVIGLFNPQGLMIVLISAGAASFGGTSGLAWGMQFMDRQRQSSQMPLQIAQSWGWIIAGIAVVLLYGVILGPSIRP